MAKIGVFGGTFNPPHNGHVKLAKEVVKELKLDKMLIIPTCIPPHKISGNLANGNHRINMCRLAFEGPEFEISSIELNRGEKSYTVETLRELKKQYPKDDLYFVVGSDMLDSFTQWYRWQEILELAHLCAASRVKEYHFDFSPYSEEQKKKISFLNFQPIEISSSEIRTKIKSGCDHNDFLDKKVAEYINQNNLYDDGLEKYREMLSAMLDSKRLYHSECVSESAADLAIKYGCDVEKARLAGLLHDVTKQMDEIKQESLIGELSDVEKTNHKVWHQMSAPEYLRKKNIVSDEEILSAIRWHTTGKSGMSILEKIVYVADFISADRKYPDVDVVRKLAYISLEHAMLYTSRYTIESLAKKDFPIHPATIDCYNDMLMHFFDNERV